MMEKKQLGQLLLNNNLITPEKLQQALERQKKTNEKLGFILIDLGFIEELQLIEFLGNQLKIPFVDLKNYIPDPNIIHLLSESDARRLRCLILNTTDDGFLVGMVDPLDILAFDELNKILKKPIQIAIIRQIDFLKIVDLIYRHAAEITNLASELSHEMGVDQFDVAQLGAGLSQEDAPVVKLLRTIFNDAFQVNASDIHIEPDENVLRIRLRVDGILQEQIINEKNISRPLALRIKLMAGLNIAETRLPQDGRFSLKFKDSHFDIRVSSLPTQFGESVVMRLLNQSEDIVSLTRIGMTETMLERVRKISSMPNGLLLITGPTGSGKSTTLYGLLSELNDPETKIITVEDPIEYHLSRINQVQVQTKINLTFVNVLRSVLRQDPDIIMIGELRDQETVAIALRAAMTGHFVFSTLHTNDAVSAATRLIDMGAEGYIVASVLRAVIAQRLLRRICRNCISQYSLTPTELVWLNSITGILVENQKSMHGKGCTYCHHTGYKGRVGVFELLEITESLANALRDNDTKQFINIIKQDENFKPLILNCLELVMNGTTTISEVMSIIGENLIDLSIKDITKINSLTRAE